MKKTLALFVCTLFITSCTTQQASTDFAAGQWIDLSHDFSDQTIYWVNADPFKREGTQGMTPKGFYYSQGNYAAAEHGGTHIDAPIHFAEGKKTVAVKMTLTAPGCGMGPVIAADAQSKIMTIDGIDDARVELVWDPAWNQEMISEEGKMKLGMI